MQISENVSLKGLNTFGIDVSSRFFVTINHLHELEELFASDILLDYPHLILGGGSNILLREDYPGVVVHINLLGMELIDHELLDPSPSILGMSSPGVFLRVQAGVLWDDLVHHCVEMGWGGLENLSLIPGQVGASPIQNIGAYGAELKDCFQSLEAFEKRTGNTVVMDREACRFEYRSSFFKHEGKDRFVITSVVFFLNTIEHRLNTSYKALALELAATGIHEPDLTDIREAVIRIRQSKLPDPAILGNAGSFFKNPVITFEQFDEMRREYPEMVAFRESNGMKVAAAWLIEKAGWKGYREGDAGVHHMQPLVLVNHGNALGKDILGLSEKISRSVKEQFSIALTPEVNIV